MLLYKKILAGILSVLILGTLIFLFTDRSILFKGNIKDAARENKSQNNEKNDKNQRDKKSENDVEPPKENEEIIELPIESTEPELEPVLEPVLEPEIEPVLEPVQPEIIQEENGIENSQETIPDNTETIPENTETIPENDITIENVTQGPNTVVTENLDENNLPADSEPKTEIDVEISGEENITPDKNIIQENLETDLEPVETVEQNSTPENLQNNYTLAKEPTNDNSPDQKEMIDESRDNNISVTSTNTSSGGSGGASVSGGVTAFSATGSGAVSASTDQTPTNLNKISSTQTGKTGITANSSDPLSNSQFAEEVRTLSILPKKEKRHGAFIQGNTGPNVLIYPFVIALANTGLFIFRKKKKK